MSIFRLSRKKTGGLVFLTCFHNTWEARPDLYKDPRWLAYALATAYHETVGFMTPLREFRRGQGRRYGKPDPVTGKTYYGRGFVQLTWSKQYKEVGQSIGLGDKLYLNPELALEYDVAAKILLEGMRLGLIVPPLRFEKYFNSTKSDWRNARRMINGLDKWQLLKRHGLRYLKCLKISDTTKKPARSISVISP